MNSKVPVDLDIIWIDHPEIDLLEVTGKVKDKEIGEAAILPPSLNVNVNIANCKDGIKGHQYDHGELVADPNSFEEMEYVGVSYDVERGVIRL